MRKRETGLPHGRQPIEHAGRALELHRVTGSRLGEGRALAVLGSALRGAGRADEAATRWREALALLTEIGAGDAGEVRALLGA